MARLYLFAEGQTEQTFADNVLSLHLARFGVHLQNAVLIAHAKKQGKVHRGGGRKYIPMKNDILRFAAQEKGGDVYFTTMIDLYAIHSDFPGLEDAEGLRSDPYKRVEQLQTSWADDIGDRRFIPFIQLHEFEAYLFAEPESLDLFYPEGKKQIANLRKTVESHQSPELIDDGQSTAPSKRIIAEFPDYEGAKAVVGPQVAELIGLETIRAACPHFDKWLAVLETLATRKHP